MSKLINMFKLVLSWMLINNFGNFHIKMFYIIIEPYLITTINYKCYHSFFIWTGPNNNHIKLTHNSYHN